MAIFKTEFHSLAMRLIAFLGNDSPSRKQIGVVEKLLINTGLITEMTFAQQLTKREQECLALAAKGYSAGETAELLAISRKTVEGHRNEIKRKLACRTMTQAVIQGIKYSYLQPKE